jgi:hypothetical protein
MDTPNGTKGSQELVEGDTISAITAYLHIHAMLPYANDHSFNLDSPSNKVDERDGCET